MTVIIEKDSWLARELDYATYNVTKDKINELCSSIKELRYQQKMIEKQIAQEIKELERSKRYEKELSIKCEIHDQYYRKIRYDNRTASTETY